MNVRPGGFKMHAPNENFGWITVCDLDDLLPQVGARALLGERQIALFRVADSTVYAIGAYDPFSDAAVLSRGIVGDIKGEPVVASPIYKHHYSLRTGRCLEKPSLGVPVYRVRLREGKILVLSPPA
ncbi:MAG TPA: nitrite reductase small subunit NirD [Gammaproteobacteria bacterium]|nr:nitrite reductase small subunit NirD [Gammaproteobacteria bacterium]